jgi:hypothetical protein
MPIDLDLTPAEKALLEIPWYHDFAVLGFPTRQRGRHFPPNQAAKQGPLFALIRRAVESARREFGSARGVELFAADGFYANFAVQAGADQVLGIDLDEEEIAKARLITRLLGNAGKATFAVEDAFALSGTHDFCICAGGLYHLADPERLLRGLREKMRGPLVIQTVTSLARTDPGYFEAPAPGWTWGCRFSHSRLLAMVEAAGWSVVESLTNELTGNTRPEDRGSAYLLCVPATG